MKKSPELFNQRNERKKFLEFSSKRKHTKKIARAGEFWWYYEGINLGREISKDGIFIRPCLVIKTNMGNGLICIIPLTSKKSSWIGNRRIEIFNWQKYGLKKRSRCIVNQVKLIDRKRLLKEIGILTVSKDLLSLIKRALVTLFSQ